jgi:hypothetical protein
MSSLLPAELREERIWEPDKFGKAVGVRIAGLDRKLSYVPLTEEEAAAVNYVFDYGLERLRMVLPSVAAIIERQRALALAMAGVAKATFPTRKKYVFPCSSNLGVAWLFPQAIRYAASPTDSLPAYTDYSANSWDIPIARGSPAYILGDLVGGTEKFYKACPTTDQHAFLLFFKDALIEYGSTPSAEQFRLISEGKVDYGVYTVDPLVEVPIEKGICAYQYPTPLGALFVDHLKGVVWKFMPKRDGVATLKPLGLVYYEYDFAKELKWVT